MAGLLGRERERERDVTLKSGGDNLENLEKSK